MGSAAALDSMDLVFGQYREAGMSALQSRCWSPEPVVPMEASRARCLPVGRRGPPPPHCALFQQQHAAGEGSGAGGRAFRAGTSQARRRSLWGGLPRPGASSVVVKSPCS